MYVGQRPEVLGIIGFKENNLMSSTKQLATSAILSALSIMLLSLSSFMPLTFWWVMLSGLVILIIRIEINLKYAIMSYVVVSSLGLMLLPNMPIILQFVMFFGCYPIIKVHLDKIEHRVKRIVAKLLVVLILEGTSLFFIAFILGLSVLVIEDTSIMFMVLLTLGHRVIGGFLYDYMLNVGLRIKTVYIKTPHKDNKS